MTIDEEYDILTAIADYAVYESNNQRKFPLTGDELINFSSIVNEFLSLDILNKEY
jgi:hypothetical protein